MIKKVNWLEAHGENNFTILCPFHDEQTPSCVIMPKKGAFHCVGCGVQGYIEEYGEFIKDNIKPMLTSVGLRHMQHLYFFNLGYQFAMEKILTVIEDRE